jgi:hypothetical protein
VQKQPLQNLIPQGKVQASRKPKIRAYSPSQMVNKKRDLYEFTGGFAESFGCPEKIAKWFITGPSFSGKSSFVFQLCHYLCQFGKVDYNSLEEGDSQTATDKIVQFNLTDVEGQFRFLAKVPVDDFRERLLKRKSAAFAVIDSVQHAHINKHSYDELVDSLCIPRRGKSLVFINHWVKNDLTKHIRHDCDIKIEVIGFVAYVQSRYGGSKPFVIWEKGAKEHWGKKYTAVINGRYWPGMKK